MTFPEIPADVSAKVKRMFRSDKRKSIAMELIYFDYWPTSEDKQRIAESYEMHVTSIDKILYKLRDSDLFTKEEGSIPLYRAKLAKEAELEPSPERIEFVEPVVEKDEPHRPEDPDEEELEIELQENRIKKIEVTIHNQGEKLDNFMTEIRASFNKLSVASPKGNPEAVEPSNNPSNPVIEEPNTLNPMSNMSGDQIYEMLVNQPREFMDMMGIQNRPPQGDIQAVPVTVRKVIVDVTTYTLTCYEKAVNDGAFDGTFSDFMNQCVYKYFEDRGLALGWHKLEKFGRLQG